jgi:hypothetical protein
MLEPNPRKPTRSLRMIIPDNVFEGRGFAQGVRGETARHDGGLDAAFGEAAVGPVPCDREVVVSVVERREPVLQRSR